MIPSDGSTQSGVLTTLTWLELHSVLLLPLVLLLLSNIVIHLRLVVLGVGNFHRDLGPIVLLPRKIPTRLVSPVPNLPPLER